MIPSGIKKFIEDHRRFLISTHINPDGDGLGAAMGLKWALTRMGKQAEIIIDSAPPSVFDFFANYQWVKSLAGGGGVSEKFETVVAIDAPNLERLGSVTSIFSENARILNIDHHISNENFGDLNYVDHNFASSAEMIFEIIKSFGLTADKDLAEYIYTGLIIDTGRFRFSNTTQQTHVTASELVAGGAEPEKISDLVFYHRTLETTRALGVFINSIELYMDGKVATAEFDYEYMHSPGWKKVNTDSFVNHALAIEGVETAYFLREIDREVTRVSLRAKHGFDVNALAGVYGGGGHAKAAGATIEAPLDKAKQILLKETAKTLG
ncbi:MAG TPA: bifunctional oligoribonuclease/PAP phosphatase NrnA [Nitrospirae bacterium]|nr:bifunctional oligoribonuclease/PAP phosphatase NrnA [Nitrospirota bacterium]